MKIINEQEVTIEAILDIFNNKDIEATIVEVAPEDIGMELKRDACLEVTSKNNKKIIMWINSYGEPDLILRMRHILISRKDMKKLDEHVLRDITLGLNQQASCFGVVDCKNLLGVTIEYKLPFQNGILDETIYSAFEELLNGVEVGLLYFEDELDDLDAP